MKLNNNQLKKIKGGASIWVAIGVITSLIFGIGVVDGYARPAKCRK